MKPINKLIIVGMAGIFLPLAAHAAAPTWGTWTAVTNNEAIQTLGGYTTIEGVNFNGSTTTTRTYAYNIANQLCWHADVASTNGCGTPPTAGSRGSPAPAGWSSSA